MNKYEKLFNQTGAEMESKKLPNLMNKGKLALENYANNVQLKIIEKESALEELDLQFVKGDVSVIPSILSTRADIAILKEDVVNVTAYQEEMFGK